MRALLIREWTPADDDVLRGSPAPGVIDVWSPTWLTNHCRGRPFVSHVCADVVTVCSSCVPSRVPTLFRDEP